MSGHRRVKEISFEEEEDYDEYGDEAYQEETQGWTAEDEENLRQGAITVRRELGPDISTSEKEIKEAIWYYYYDLDQVVAYLRRKNTPQEPKKQHKKLSRFDEAAQAAQAAQSKIGQNSKALFSSDAGVDQQAACLRTFSAAEFFKDIPWLNVPSARLSNMTAAPLYPRVGLLGGSANAVKSKPSKLAALATSRKRAQEEKRRAGNTSELEETEPEKGMSRSIMLLDRLAGKQNTKSANVVISLPVKKAEDSSEHVFTAKSVYPTSENREAKALDGSRALQDTGTLAKQDTNLAAEDLRATPSVFAETMLGNQLRHSINIVTEDNFTLLPSRGNSILTDNPFTDPSPDDVVTNAQLKGGKNKSVATKKATTDTTIATNGIAAIKLDDLPKPKSKNLDVLGEFKKSNSKNAASFVVIGHVDHGKSTLMGRLLYDLKIVNQRSVDKLRAEATTVGKSSFALAWLMDSTSEERQRGVTVDIATNNFETERTRFTILDAPGHRDFIPNMIAGASQADFAVLVIDASANAFEAGLRGQTKEHALLVRSMGIARMVVAVNKMDAANWSQERFNEISQQMTAFFLAAGFQAKNIAFIPCSGLTGENVVTKILEGVAPWYNGRTLVEELDASEPSTRALAKPLRLTIADVFRGGVQNPLSISGRIEAGSLQTGDIMLAMPASETATIKAIEVEGKPAEWAVAGQIATLHLSDIDPVHLRQGDIVCSPTDKPIANVKSFVAKILAFEHVTPGWVDVHRGRLHTPARLSDLVAILDKSSGTVEKKRPRVIRPGAVARVKVELERPLPLEVDGRVVLRSEGATLAAGLIEGVNA